MTCTKDFPWHIKSNVEKSGKPSAPARRWTGQYWAQNQDGGGLLPVSFRAVIRRAVCGESANNTDCAVMGLLIQQHVAVSVQWRTAPTQCFMLQQWHNHPFTVLALKDSVLPSSQNAPTTIARSREDVLACSVAGKRVYTTLLYSIAHYTCPNSSTDVLAWS